MKIDKDFIAKYMKYKQKDIIYYVICIRCECVIHLNTNVFENISFR